MKRADILAQNFDDSHELYVANLRMMYPIVREGLFPGILYLIL